MLTSPFLLGYLTIFSSFFHLFLRVAGYTNNNNINKINKLLIKIKRSYN